MAKLREIRADFDRNSVVVYQAYAPGIADRAVEAQTFVAPFSFTRMTWIKPSFLWLMHRSNWGRKKNQEKTLAIRITKDGWTKALRHGVLTHYEPTTHQSPEDWQSKFNSALVHIQWDTERSLRGAGLNHQSIQVGISRHLIREFVHEWILAIEDVSSRVRRIHEFTKTGRAEEARKHLPPERIYPTDPSHRMRLNMV